MTAVISLQSQRIRAQWHLRIINVVRFVTTRNNKTSTAPVYLSSRCSTSAQWPRALPHDTSFASLILLTLVLWGCLVMLVIVTTALFLWVHPIFTTIIDHAQ